MALIAYEWGAQQPTDCAGVVVGLMDGSSWPLDLTKPVKYWHTLARGGPPPDGWQYVGYDDSNWTTAPGGYFTVDPQQALYAPPRHDKYLTAGATWAPPPNFTPDTSGNFGTFPFQGYLPSQHWTDLPALSGSGSTNNIYVRVNFDIPADAEYRMRVLFDNIVTVWIDGEVALPASSALGTRSYLVDISQFPISLGFDLRPDTASGGPQTVTVNVKHASEGVITDLGNHTSLPAPITGQASWKRIVVPLTTLWKPNKDQEIRIERVSALASAGTPITSFSDNFNRANGTLGPVWDDNGFLIESNQVRNSALAQGVTGTLMVAHTAPPYDITFDLAATSDGTSGAISGGVIWDWKDPLNFHMFHANAGSTGFYRIVNGQATGNGPSGESNSVIGGAGVGTYRVVHALDGNVTIYKNGAQRGVVVNSPFSLGHRSGLYIDNATVRLDNLSMTYGRWESAHIRNVWVDEGSGEGMGYGSISTTPVVGTRRTSTTVALPTGVVAGNLLLAFVVQDPYSASAPTCDGWTLLTSKTATSTNNAMGNEEAQQGAGGRADLYAKIATSSEPSDYTWTHALGQLSVSITRIAGSGHSIPAAAAFATPTLSTTDVVKAPDISVANSSSLVMQFFVKINKSSSIDVEPVGVTKVADFNDYNSSSNLGHGDPIGYWEVAQQAVYYAHPVAAGTFTGKTIDWAPGIVGIASMGFTLVVSPVGVINEGVARDYGEYPKGFDYTLDVQDGVLGGVDILNDAGGTSANAYFAEQGSGEYAIYSQGSTWRYNRPDTSDGNSVGAARSTYGFDDSGWTGSGTSPFAAYPSGSSLIASQAALGSTTFAFPLDIWIRKDFYVPYTGTYRWELYFDNYGEFWIDGVKYLDRVYATNGVGDPGFRSGTLTLTAGWHAIAARGSGDSSQGDSVDPRLYVTDLRNLQFSMKDNAVVVSSPLTWYFSAEGLIVPSLRLTARDDAYAITGSAARVGPMSSTSQQANPARLSERNTYF